MFTTELLERRRLLSVSVKFDPTFGRLDVIGNGRGNDIRVAMVDTEMLTPVALTLTTASSRPGPMLRGVSVYDGLNLIFNSASASRRPIDIRSVDVLGSEGADRITMLSINSRVIANVFAGGSPDTIFATANNASLAAVNGGDGNDLIDLSFSDGAIFNGPDGSAGDDSISVNGNLTPSNVRQTARQPVALNGDARSRLILGGDGNDSITLVLQSTARDALGYEVQAGIGDDVVHGSAAADRLYGGDGNDKMLAGAGNDYVNGGLGDDYINGEAGNDFLDHGGGRDVVDGGDGRDIASVGEEDKFFNIEELV